MTFLFLTEHLVAPRTPHQCSICDVCTATPMALDKHMRLHSESRPYACTTCDRRFSSRCILSDHVRNTHQEKTHECNFCGRRFKRVTHWKKHIEIHSKKLKCKMCTKSFDNQEQLERHEQVHSKQRMYKCDGCEKRFDKPCRLRKHQEGQGTVKNSDAGCKAFRKLQQCRNHKPEEVPTEGNSVEKQLIFNRDGMKRGSSEKISTVRETLLLNHGKIRSKEGGTVDLNVRTRAMTRKENNLTSESTAYAPENQNNGFSNGEVIREDKLSNKQLKSVDREMTRKSKYRSSDGRPDKKQILSGTEREQKIDDAHHVESSDERVVENASLNKTQEKIGLFLEDGMSANDDGDGNSVVIDLSRDDSTSYSSHEQEMSSCNLSNNESSVVPQDPQVVVLNDLKCVPNSPITSIRDPLNSSELREHISSMIHRSLIFAPKHEDILYQCDTAQQEEMTQVVLNEKQEEVGVILPDTIKQEEEEIKPIGLELKGEYGETNRGG